MSNKKFTSFSSSISKGYRVEDDKVKIKLQFTEDELNIIVKAFMKSKKTGLTNKYLIEEFLKDSLMEKMENY
jgi:hypothetical protein